MDRLHPLLSHAQIPIARQRVAVGVERKELILIRGAGGGDFIRRRRDFVKGSPLVNLIEHRPVKHGRAGAGRIINLPPKELPAVARNLVQGRIGETAVQVVRRITGIRHGQQVNAVALTIRQVRDERAGLVGVGLRVGAVAAHCPWTKHVERPIDRSPGCIGLRIAAERSPVSGHPAHDRATGGFEIVDDSLRIGRGHRQTAVETQPPNPQQRLASMLEVARAVGEVEGAGHVSPIVLQVAHHHGRIVIGNVVHEEEHAPVGLSAQPNVH